MALSPLLQYRFGVRRPVRGHRAKIRPYPQKLKKIIRACGEPGKMGGVATAGTRVTFRGTQKIHGQSSIADIAVLRSSDAVTAGVMKDRSQHHKELAVAFHGADRPG